MLSDKEKEAIELLEDYLICGNKEGVLCRNLRIISTIIEKQSKEIEELKKPKYLINFKTNEITKLTNDFVSKDKIKAKIEEVEQWELYNMRIPRLSTLDERLGAKIGIKYVLQSLLEKED